MTDLAVLGGSGLSILDGLQVSGQHLQDTPYGETSGPLTTGTYADKKIIFLPRHGHPHVVPPHKVNYRANIWALKEKGVQRIISINAVGGITKEMYPCRLVIPDQIIDYTWGRNHTFFEEGLSSVTHIDFTRPYSDMLRNLVSNAAEKLQLDIRLGGTYGATQGPRLETAAEIVRMERDGCDIVGMTSMPEAALAQELEMEYASISVVVNWAAGKSVDAITMDIIQKNIDIGMESVRALLKVTIQDLENPA